MYTILLFYLLGAINMNLNVTKKQFDLLVQEYLSKRMPEVELGSLEYEKLVRDNIEEIVRLCGMEEEVEREDEMEEVEDVDKGEGEG